MSLNRSLLSQITDDLEKKKKPSKPKVPRNQWQHPGEITKVNSPNITMQGVSYPVLGVPNVGPAQIMQPDQDYNYPGASNVTEYPQMGSGGYTVTRSHDRKGKTHKVTGPDGTVKYFGDSKLGQHPSDPARKKAFYARHKKNLAGNPYFRAFARATWQDGGETDSTLENIAEVFDPTGISSLDDVYRSAKDPNSKWYDTAIEVVGAVPMLGKLGKITKAGIHLKKYSGLEKALFKTLPQNATVSKSLDGLGLIGRSSDAIQAAQQAPGNRFFPFKEGGQTRDEREMVNGIADILSQVNDPQNRAQIAQQMIKDFKDEDVTFDYDKFMEMSKLKNGGMIKRADGSYSKRGLWDNIRANKGSGKKPTPEMLEQERKIRAKEKRDGGSTFSGGLWYADGGTPDNAGFKALPTYVQAKIMSEMAAGGEPQNAGFNALPEFVQAKIMGNMADGGQMPRRIALARFAAAGNLDQMDDYGYKKGGSTYSGGVWFDQGGQIMYQHGGEFVDLQKQYGVDPLSKVGIEKAKELAAKDPSIRFVCNASGCAQIAADAADAYGQDFSRGNAWDMGNLNNVNYLNPKYKPFMGKAEPLPDPKSYNTGNDFINAEMQIVGLNRTNNVRSNENKKLTNTPKNIKAAAAATKDLANDSFDYANRALYPDTRGYEHVGFNLGSGQLLHGTGANTEHPAFYTIDNMKDGISLPGYGKYDPVETFGPSNMWQKAMNAIGMRKKGGSTYSGGVWFQNGGNPFFPVVTEEDTSLEALYAQMPGGNQTEQQPAAAAVFGQQLQDRVAKDNPAFTGKATFNSKLGAVNNVLAKGMAGNPVLGAIGNVIDGINNQKDYNVAQDKQKQNYSTDYAYGTTYNTPVHKGQYDMYGTMMPNQIGGNLSFTGMNQKYSYAEGGDNTMETSALSWIPKDLGPVGRPFIDAAPMAAAPAGKPAEAKDALNLRFNLDGNFQDYAEKAQKFLDKKSPGSDISGVDLAGAAQAAYQKTGKLVPVELALAQLQIEGYLAQGSKPNKPQRTKNPFNVGNTDSGAVVKHDTAASGIKAYYDLMTTQYLKNKSPEELLVNFTNSNGNRYATDRSYEKKLKDTIGSMKFQQGGEMELTEQEINYIRAMGGEVEFL